MYKKYNIKCAKEFSRRFSCYFYNTQAKTVLFMVFTHFELYFLFINFIYIKLYM